MNKKILNEINEIKYLFDYKRGVVISEQSPPSAEADKIISALNNASEWTPSHGGTSEQDFTNAIRKINSVDLFKQIDKKIQGGLQELINNEFDVSNKGDKYWLNQMKNHFSSIGVNMGFTNNNVSVSAPDEVTAPAAAAPAAKTPSIVVDNWEDVKKYYKDKQNVDPEKKEDDTNTWETLTVTENGRIYILNTYSNNLRGKDNNYVRGTWSWDGTKPVFSLYKTSRKETTGYVNDTDTDWSDAIGNNKVIGLGATGPLVKELQKALIVGGYADGLTITKDMEGCKSDVEKCDGIYGEQTKKAVIKAQQDLEIDDDGVVGRETYDALPNLG